jgi:hypothetical protein
MNCIYCQSQIELETALENSPFSWPEMSTIWHECRKCGHGNHIRFESGRYSQIKMLGAPGPDWDSLNDFPEVSISIRQDPEYLHVWFKGKHYEIRARA